MEELVLVQIYQRCDVPYASNRLKVPKPGKTEKRDVIDMRLTNP
jgi:hypothetical protein